MCILGLFSKAIAQSGTNLAPWSQPAHKGVAKKRAKQLAKYFSCYKSNDWSHTIDCLRNVPAVNITAAFYEFFVSITNLHIQLLIDEAIIIDCLLIEIRNLIWIQWSHFHRWWSLTCLEPF